MSLQNRAAARSWCRRAVPVDRRVAEAGRDLLELRPEAAQHVGDRRHRREGSRTRRTRRDGGAPYPVHHARQSDARERVSDENDVVEITLDDLARDRVREVGNGDRAQVGRAGAATRQIDGVRVGVEERDERFPAGATEATAVNQHERHLRHLSTCRTATVCPAVRRRSVRPMRCPDGRRRRDRTRRPRSGSARSRMLRTGRPPRHQHPAGRIAAREVVEIGIAPEIERDPVVFEAVQDQRRTASWSAGRNPAMSRDALTAAARSA